MWGVLEVGRIGYVNLADRCPEFQTSSTKSLGLKRKRLRNLICRCSAQTVSADDGCEHQTLVTVGGGAAGVYGALRAKSLCPNLKVIVLEKGKLLSKVRISGGGRCNVTTGLFKNPEPLAGQYPRGHKELRGTYFRTHGPQDTAAWFMERGVVLKTESDGRMFPESNSSATIVECLLNEAHRIGVVLQTNVQVDGVRRKGDKFNIEIGGGDAKRFVKAEFVLLATGSAHQGYKIARQLGHSIVEPRPSLFTFKVTDTELTRLSGVGLPRAALYCPWMYLIG